jgi:hypothetical protein
MQALVRLVIQEVAQGVIRWALRRQPRKRPPWPDHQD